MISKKSFWVLITFNLIYILWATIYYVSIRNYEFLWYISVLAFFFVLILTTLKKSHFDLPILWGLSIWGALHMAGGSINIGGEVLYNFVFVNLFSFGDNIIFKFDQLVHLWGFGVTALVAFHLLEPYLNKKTNYKVIYGIVIAAAMGAGALNEVIEFIAVLVSPNTNVGGYYNTATDLIFNMIGAILATVIIHFRRK
jgi:hypothetical protein